MGELLLVGRVVVVAGDAPALADVASRAVAAGAQVALVSLGLDADIPATVRFRADPRDRGVWDRLAMHVEQHLGPVDGVATDAASRPTVDDVFAADLARRGHGRVVTVSAADDADAVLTVLCDRPRAEPSPPAAAPPDR